uniref:Uncharacterized protein n=1 Tax=Lygus hesperus TaxID=30085 RepID=A0A0A9XT27_LYGHE
MQLDAQKRSKVHADKSGNISKTDTKDDKDKHIVTATNTNNSTKVDSANNTTNAVDDTNVNTSTPSNDTNAATEKDVECVPNSEQAEQQHSDSSAFNTTHT